MNLYDYFEEMLEELKRRRDKCGPTDGAAARELSMAITDLENAWTHTNAGTYYKAGTYHRTDSDSLNPSTWD